MITEWQYESSTPGGHSWVVVERRGQSTRSYVVHILCGENSSLIISALLRGTNTFYGLSCFSRAIPVARFLTEEASSAVVFEYLQPVLDRRIQVEYILNWGDMVLCEFRDLADGGLVLRNYLGLDEFGFDREGQLRLKCYYGFIRIPRTSPNHAQAEVQTCEGVVRIMWYLLTYFCVDEEREMARMVKRYLEENTFRYRELIGGVRDMQHAVSYLMERNQ